MILILPYNVDYRVLLSMDSTCYTIMYNDNSGMYHEPRHEHLLYFLFEYSYIFLNIGII